MSKMSIFSSLNLLTHVSREERLPKYHLRSISKAVGMPIIDHTGAGVQRRLKRCAWQRQRMDIKVLSLPVNVQLDPRALDWGTQRELRGVGAPQRHGGLWKDGIGERWHIRISAPVLQRKRFF